MPDVPALSLRRCSSCGALEPAKRAFCAACGNAGLEPVKVDGAGRLVSWTVVRRPASAFRHLGAIPIVVVRLDSDATITGRLAGETSSLAPGDRMILCHLDEDVPVFRRDEAA